MGPALSVAFSHIIRDPKKHVRIVYLKLLSFGLLLCSGKFLFSCYISSDKSNAFSDQSTNCKNYEQHHF